MKTGLHLPSSNLVVLSILENYLPTALATFFEPIWVILNQIICLLIPFEALRHGNARSKASIEANYTSLPPQFVIWRALRSGLFLLAVVCLVAVSTNLLSVTMSTLLNEGLVTVNSPIPSQQLVRPIFNDSGTAPAMSFAAEGYDHFYTLLSHVTHKTSLPSWIDGNYFYFPFTCNRVPSISGSNQVQQFRGSTLGFGAEASCKNLSPGEGDGQFLLRMSQDGAIISLQTSHLLSNGTLIKCLPTGGSWFANQIIGRVPLGSLAVEFMRPMLAPPDVDDGGFCSNLFVLGWARADNLLGVSSNSTTFNFSNATFLACTGTARAAQFQVIVDASGLILDSKQTSPFSADTSQYFTGDASEMRLINEAINLMNEPAPQTAVDYTAVGPLGTWHNSSYTSDWVNSLFVIILNSQDLGDPSAPIPDGNLLATVMGEL